MEEKEFLFTVIIPTYNPKEYLPTLLESITHNECADQIEVIISDDCSVIPFDDVIEEFKDRLYIRTISNEKHAGFPRNGRQHGAEEAKGKWMCFADQDDFFVDEAFDRINTFIKHNKVRNMIAADFIEEDVETGERKIRDKEKGWTHGKFYEKAFWDKYEICYDNVQYCEDINLSLKISCLLVEKNLKKYDYNEALYVWRRRGDSLASKEYFIASMPDYAQSTLGVIIEYLEKHKDNQRLHEDYAVKFISTFLHVYFYFQSAILWDQKIKMMETINVVQPLFTRFKELTGLQNDTLLYLLHTNMIEIYEHTRVEDFSQIPFIEQISVREWVNLYFE